MDGMVDMELPTVITAGSHRGREETTIPVADASEVDALKEGKTFLHFFGVISYEDIFGDTHRTPFRYIWRPQFIKAVLSEKERAVEGDSSYWEKYGPEEDNQAT